MVSAEFTSIPIDAEAQAPANTPASVITLGRFFAILGVTLVVVATIFVVVRDSPGQVADEAYQEHGGELGPALSRYLHGAGECLLSSAIYRLLSIGRLNIQLFLSFSSSIPHLARSLTLTRSTSVPHAHSHPTHTLRR